ncbi:MAG: hypothetical protein QM788_00665 [Roseateles sp.]|uniref:DUF6624 domain-containing protein n=1 Tax=Roseateles sp. TaxID=1971397 RepID=UPI0039E85211
MKAAALALGLACAAALPAAAVELVLPCVDAAGRPVAGTVVKAIRDDFSGEPVSALAHEGACRIELPAQAWFVKAEAPGLRATVVRVVAGAAPGRVLRLLPLSGQDAGWQRQLRQMAERDQVVRHALGEAQQQGDAARIAQAERDMAAADDAHRAQLARWLQARGFPRVADVGMDGVGDAWLLLQHEPGLMAPYLDDLRAAVAAGELARANLALSEDRIALVQGRPQRYGSQLSRGAGGRLALHPLVDAEQVDTWRAEMDLEPLAAYLARFPR